MGPPLRFERTTLITGSAPLIRLVSLGTFPQGKARAGRGPAPTANNGADAFFS